MSWYQWVVGAVIVVAFAGSLVGLWAAVFWED